MPSGETIKRTNLALEEASKFMQEDFSKGAKSVFLFKEQRINKENVIEKNRRNNKIAKRSRKHNRRKK